MTECKCGRPTRDHAYVCEDCGDALARALGDVPWLAEQLDISVTGQKGVDYRRVGGGKGGKKPSERPSPVAWGPSEARAHLRALLVSWVLFCEAEDVRHQSATSAMPADDLPALSRWMLNRVDGLMLYDIGSEAVDEITDAVAKCHRLVDRPAERQYLGTCDVDPNACVTGRLYSRPGSKWARCDNCGTTVDADVIRARLLTELDDRLCTAAEIARLSTYLGLKANRDAVRKRINQWHARGLLVEHAGLTDEVTFRFGTVYAKLAADEYGDTRATAS
jgi:hypothetical protein